MAASTVEPSADNYLGIRRACRTLHNEASEILYSEAEITVTIVGIEKNFGLPWKQPVPGWKQMDFWPSVRNLRLEILLSDGDGEKEAVMERVHSFVEDKIEHGKHLKSLEVAFTAFEFRRLPGYPGEVVEILAALSVSGNVLVEVSNYDFDDAEFRDICKDLQKRIKK